MDIPVVFTEKVRAVAPIHGVGFRNLRDKGTWRIDFKDEATQAQRDAAQAVLDGFNVVAEQALLDAAENTKKAAVKRLRNLPGGASITAKDLRDAGLI